MCNNRLIMLSMSLTAAISISYSINATPSRQPSVAVVIDADCYSQAKDAVDEYVTSMELDGKRGILIVDEWGVPDSIKVRLMKLHEEDALEGAVLIGDIPIPMIRDAQHLSSAFKMDQKRDWKDSSIPSDRFYDDFHLQFTFLKRDADRDELFYYSLAPESPQKIHSDIYTSRIKPAECQDKNEAVSTFLRKAVEAKKMVNGINPGSDDWEEAVRLRETERIMFFAGHGYNSESMVSRMNEYKALHEQFPSVNKRGGRVDFINFDFDESVKCRLLSTLGNEDLDVALLHHHGYNDMQLLNGSPYVSTPDGWLSLAQNYFRTKMRSSRNPEGLKKDYIQRFGIPGKWLDDANDPELAEKDSLYERSLDIYTDDIDQYGIKARFVLFDACFNGAFNEPDYIVPHYLFGSGNNTLSALAHSVNTLQDLWTDELVGLFDEGVCAGNIFKNVWTLETHLFGDPTFHFGIISGLDKKISLEENDPKTWRRLLKADTSCDIKCLAIRILTRSGNISGEELLDIQRNASSGVVRLAGFNGNVELAGNSLTEAISMGLDDSYELLQRISARYAGYNQSPELAEKIIRLYLDPATPVRVLFQLKTALVDIESRKAVKLIAENGHWKGEAALNAVIEYVNACGKSTEEELRNLKSDSPDMRNARLFIRSQRNQCRADVLEGIGAYYTKADPAIKQLIAEVFGWYRYSYAREKAAEICSGLHNLETDQTLKDELRRSLSRLEN